MQLPGRLYSGMCPVPVIHAMTSDTAFDTAVECYWFLVLLRLRELMRHGCSMEVSVSCCCSWRGAAVLFVHLGGRIDYETPASCLTCHVP